MSKIYLTTYQESDEYIVLLGAFTKLKTAKKVVKKELEENNSDEEISIFKDYGERWIINESYIIEGVEIDKKYKLNSNGRGAPYIDLTNY